MEESTCYRMVIGLLKQFSCMKCCFFFCLHVFISFKQDFHADAESMIVRRLEMSIIAANIFYFTERKFFRRENLSILIDYMIN